MNFGSLNPGRLAGRLLLAGLAASILLIYVPPVPVAVVVCALLGALTLLLPVRDSGLLIVTALLLTLALEGAARLLEGKALSAHYRPHELLAAGARYKPSQQLTMDVQHGDLIATDPTLPRELAEPRTQVFRTDSRGYRNDAEYSGQDLLVVGDSFVAGNGNSQEYTLTAQLRAGHGIEGYNLGFAAGPVGYAERINWARSEFPEASCLALVFFEGNDFQPMQASDVVLRNQIPSGLQDLVGDYVGLVRKPFHLSRVVYGLWTRAVARLRNDAGQADAEQHAFVRTVAGRPMGFLRGYAEVVQRQAYDDFGFIRARLTETQPDLLMFVPDKFRIYGPLSDEPPPERLPDAQWRHLESVAAELGIPAVNATAAMQSRAEEAVGRGDVIYWRDDTHWNPAGIAVGAQVLASALKEHPSVNCRMAAGQH